MPRVRPCVRRGVKSPGVEALEQLVFRGIAGGFWFIVRIGVGGRVFTSLVMFGVGERQDFVNMIF